MPPTRSRPAGLQESGRFEMARACYDAATLAKPDFAMAYFNKGTLHMATSKPALAIQSFHKVITRLLYIAAATSPSPSPPRPPPGHCIAAHLRRGLLQHGFSAAGHGQAEGGSQQLQARPPGRPELRPRPRQPRMGAPDAGSLQPPKPRILSLAIPH